MKPFKLPARLWQTLLLVLTAAAFSPLSVFAAEAGEEAYTPSVYATAWALLPPIIAIGLALITKEVYSSLFLGIVMGGLLYSGFSFEGTTMHVLEDGFISVLSDSYNVRPLGPEKNQNTSRCTAFCHCPRHFNFY